MKQTYRFTIDEMNTPLYAKTFEFGYEQGYDDGRKSIIIEQKAMHKTDPDTKRCLEWVRTADKLPLHFSNTLVVMGGKITLGLYDCNCWFFYNEDKNKWEMDEYDRVTHWMPIPPLPEVEG